MTSSVDLTSVDLTSVDLTSVDMTSVDLTSVDLTSPTKDNALTSTKASLDLFGAPSPPPSATSSRIYEGSVNRVNEYEGYEPPGGVTYLTERLSAAELDPEKFFNDFVALRRPVAISGHLNDRDWKGNLWTNEYLKERAGRATVLVEKRKGAESSTRGAFGVKSQMVYGRFLSELEQGNEDLYMTTQDLEQDESDLDEYGIPQAVAGEPLRSLEGEFPLSPLMLGNLIPSQLSLWQGASRVGASSGLHHDFHDNLYVLIRGHKRFRLFPPSATGILSPTGAVTKIHRNGLIVYEFRDGCRTVNIRSDGVPLAFLARRKREEAETDLADAEDELLMLREKCMAAMEGSGGEAANGGGGLGEEGQRLRAQIRDCEDLIDEAIAETIRYGDASDEEDDEVISISDDDEDEDEPAAKHARLEEEVAGSETGKDKVKGKKPAVEHLESNFCKVALPGEFTKDELETFLAKLYESKKVEVQSGCGDDISNKEDISLANKDSENADSESCSEKIETTINGPIESSKDQCGKPKTNGSTVRSRTPKALPVIPEIPPTFGCLVVDLKPGEMLYIPASWFHEVTSRSSESAASCRDSETPSDITPISVTPGDVTPGDVTPLSVTPVGVVFEEKSSAEDGPPMPDRTRNDNVVTADGSTTTAQQVSVESDDVIGSSLTNREKASATQEDNGAGANDASTIVSHGGKVSDDLLANGLESLENAAEHGAEATATESSAVSVATVSDVTSSSACVAQGNSNNVVTIDNKACGVEKPKVIRKTAAEDFGHLAFNYWVYPPDSKDFYAPYQGEFWSHRWRQLRTLRCTMGRATRPRQVQGRKGGNSSDGDHSSSSSVINLSDDSENDSDQYSYGDSSDCYPMERPISLGTSLEAGSSPIARGQWGACTEHERRAKISSLLINDASNPCEIIDDDDKYDDEYYDEDDDGDDDDCVEGIESFQSGGEGVGEMLWRGVTSKSNCDDTEGGKASTETSQINKGEELREAGETLGGDGVLSDTGLSDTVTLHSDTVTPHCDTVTPHSDTVTPHCDTVTPHSDTVTPHCDTVTPHCDTVTPHSDTVCSDATSSHIEQSDATNEDTARSEAGVIVSMASIKNVTDKMTCDTIMTPGCDEVMTPVTQGVINSETMDSPSVKVAHKDVTLGDADEDDDENVERMLEDDDGDNAGVDDDNALDLGDSILDDDNQS